jgi:glycosyltransferase involved in cell wall biosynthesis
MNQNYTNYRLVIIDDLSSDDTFLKINQYIKKNNMKK